MSRLKEKDDFGNRMKVYEAVETARKLDPLLPIYARIDGRSFSRFTRGSRVVITKTRFSAPRGFA